MVEQHPYHTQLQLPTQERVENRLGSLVRNAVNKETNTREDGN